MEPAGIVYEYWVHQDSGDIYAVRLRERQVTGICGPLAFETLTARENMSALPYREAAWTEEHREAYSPVDQWLRGRF